MCSDGGGVNHPCPWPLAALISGERWSRTRSISNAAGNDTSPAPPGPQPRKGLHSPAQRFHYCLLLHTATTLFSTSRGIERRREKKKKVIVLPFLLGPEKQQEDEEGQSGGFYLRSHLLVLYRRVILPGLSVSVCLTQTRAPRTAAHMHVPARTGR